MSHTVAIKTIFRHKKGLFKAFEALGWKIAENRTCRTYPSDPKRSVVYDYIAVNPQTNGYDIGLTKNGDTYELNCDFFDRSIENQLGGREFVNLKKQYVMKTAEIEIGEVEIMEQLADGSLIIEVDDGT